MKAEILPDWENDFVNEKDIAAFREALDAPSIDTITSVNDWGPVRQKVRKKRRKPKRGKDETREGFGYIILRWPVLVGVLTWLLVLSICYASVRVYITLQEWLIVWRGKRKTLRQRLRKARTLEEWHHAAKELDDFLGNTKWMQGRQDFAYYDASTVQRATQNMREARELGDLNALRGHVEACIKANFAGTCNPELYSQTFFGTKRLVNEFVEEAERSLACLLETDRLSGEDKRVIFKYLGRNYGRSALCFSGGACFAFYHFGVVKALHEASLLPNVITGTSGGGIVAALACTRTDEELRKLLIPELASKIRACQEDYRTWIPRWWRTGARFDSCDWARKSMWFTRGSTTFKEAYDRSGRILNITAIPSDPTSPAILLNHLTAPDCVIWSSLLASSAVPGILNPIVLMMKTKSGELAPFSFGHKWRDGSLRTDIPIQALNSNFNVNFTIVSQVNPHINMFFFAPRGAVGRPVAHRRGKGWRGGFVGSVLEQFIKLDLNKWLKALKTLELLPRPAYTDFSSVWLQKFEGTITIWPKAKFSDFYYILSDPSISRLANMIMVGQKATWPKLEFTSHRMRVERLIERGRSRTVPNKRASDLLDEGTVISGNEMEEQNEERNVMAQRAKTIAMGRLTMEDSSEEYSVSAYEEESHDEL